MSAFFSGSETAFFSLTKIQLKKLEKSDSFLGRKVFRLLARSRKLLITILLGNTLVNILAASIATEITLYLGHYWDLSDRIISLMLLGQVGLITLIILIFGEISPKLVAFAKAETYARYGSVILEFLLIILYPVVVVLEWISHLVSRKKELRELDTNQITSDDLRSLIRYRTPKHPLEDSEKKMIAGIIDLPSTLVSEIMVPRVDIVAVNYLDPESKIRQVIKDSGHSRIPVYRKSIDNITGFIYAKDLILRQNGNGRIPDRKPIFVPGNMTIQNLLNQFRQSKIHIAIVVDEYGGTAGLISLEDILEEMFGEIRDEHDNERDKVIKISEHSYRISGMCSVNELNEMFDLGIDEEAYDNFAGYLFDTLNHVPIVGESHLLPNGVLLTIVELINNRIDSVRIDLPDTAGEDS